MLSRMIGYRLHELGWSEYDALTKGPRTRYAEDCVCDKIE